MIRAAFLDRDGILVEPVMDAQDGRLESPLRPEDVRLVDGAADALYQLTDAGWLVVVASNQPAAAKGKVSFADLDAVHARVVELLGTAAARVTAWTYCRHHSDAGPCDCRKPAPGLLLAAAEAYGIDLSASWMVGDTDADIGAGRAAGCRTLLVEHPGSAHKRRAEEPDARVPDLAAAVALVLG